jgi:hypothetical protein
MNGGGLPAYGLTANPFTMGTLNPLISPEDKDRVSFVDGWKDLRRAQLADAAADDQHVGDAERLIRQRVAEDKAVFFVVAGTSSTGRTSIAYYLVHLWAEAHKIDCDLVVAERNDPGPDGGSFSPEGQLLEWAYSLRLREDIDTLGLSLTAKQQLENLTESDQIVKFGLAFQSVDKELRRAGREGKDEVRRLAAILERGKGDDLVKKVKQAFQATKAIVIITVDESADTAKLLLNARLALPASEGLCIKVGPIMGADVKTVAEDRWNAVREGVRNPFVLEEIERVFNSPRTIARTVRLLERMLDIRHGLYHGRAFWPDSPNLELTGDVMRGLLAGFENTLPD